MTPADLIVTDEDVALFLALNDIHPDSERAYRIKNGLSFTCEVEQIAAHRLAVIAAERERAKWLVEALTPSGDTKAAYMGEFSFPVADTDEDGSEYTRKQYVPWDTIKQIMAAIVSRATSNKDRP